MGLDMYLRAGRYIGGYDHSTDKDKYETLVEMFDPGFTDPEAPSATVQFTVAYWRKANMIHRWFVENVQNGVDECEDAYVRREQLVELRNLCQATLESVETETTTESVNTLKDGKLMIEQQQVRKVTNPEVAMAHLPPTSGFFFGGTEVDEWYLRDLEYTMQTLDRILALADDEWSFEYQSSW